MLLVFWLSNFCSKTMNKMNITFITYIRPLHRFSYCYDNRFEFPIVFEIKSVIIAYFYLT